MNAALAILLLTWVLVGPFAALVLALCSMFRNAAQSSQIASNRARIEVLERRQDRVEGNSSAHGEI